MSDQKLPLTIYLIKPERVATFEKEISPQSTFELAAPLDGYVLSFPASSGEPAWAAAIKGSLQDATNFSVFGQSPSAMMVVRQDGNTFVLAFGHAAARLEDAWLERDFGRRVALNSIPSNKLIEIHLEQVFAKWHVSRERAPRATSVEEFGVEFDRDLVARVEGIPKDKSLGATVRGSTSLRLKIPFSELSAILTKANGLYGSNRYKRNWPDIDNINPVVDEPLITRLDLELDKEMADSKAMKQMVMLVPLHRQEEDLSADSYVFGRLGKNPVMAPYLLFEGWSSHVKSIGRSPDLSEAKKTAVHLLDGEKNELGKCSAYDCFGYELALNQRQYILSSGVWYEVATDFIARVNAQAKKLRPPKELLPAWDGKSSEGQYNLTCGERAGFLNFDAKNILYGGGQSKFEICDVLHLASKTLYFAKIPTRSSGVSHLVEQVRRTTELLFGEDGEFRKAIQQSMKKHHKGQDSSWLESRPKNSEWNLCMVSLGKSPMDLPFFARCAVRRLYLEMRRRGFEVSFLAV
jgi:uncharacterized protein (TIGR04141 family)